MKWFIGEGFGSDTALVFKDGEQNPEDEHVLNHMPSIVFHLENI